MLTKSALIFAAAAAVSDAVVHPVHMMVPPINTPAAPNQGFGPIGGRVDPTLLPSQNPNDYKLVLYISGDNGATWWDKMHTLYLVYLADPDAGNSQMKGIPIHADWSWNMTQWASPGAPTDGTSTLFRAYVIPYAYDTKWPEYQVEGGAIPASLTSSSYGGAQVNRATNTVTYYDATGVTAADQTAVAEDGVGVAPISNVPVGSGAVSVTPSASRAASASSTPSRSASASGSVAASPSPSVSVSTSVAASASRSVSATGTASGSVAASASRSQVASATPSSSVQASVSASWSTGASASVTPSVPASASVSASATVSAAASQVQQNDGTTPNLRAGSGVDSIAMGAAAVMVLVASVYAAAA